MRTRSSARRRVRYELLAVCVLSLVLLTVMLWRGGGREEAAAQPAATPGPPTAVPSPSPIPPDMFEWREGEYVHVERGEKHSTLLDESYLTDVTVKSAKDLVNWAKMAWDNQWGYVWGTYGSVLTEELLASKIEQFGEEVRENESIIREKWMNGRVADCAGLIKGYCWYDPEQHNIVYGYGDVPDIGTDGFYDRAEEKGPIDTLPETPGLLVYSTKGHIGVYIGDGWAIEAISTPGGVVKTRVADRTWTHWLKCPFIEY